MIFETELFVVELIDVYKVINGIRIWNLIFFWIDLIYSNLF